MITIHRASHAQPFRTAGRANFTAGNVATLVLRAGGCLALLLFGASPTLAAWEKVTLPHSKADVGALAIAPTNVSRLYMGVSVLGVYRTDDRGTTWIRTADGLPLNASVFAIDVSPLNADHAWAGVAGAVWRTTNAGASWTQGTGIPTGGSISDILVHATNPSILHAIRGALLFRSTDAGATWAPAGTNLNAQIYEVEARSANPDLILASTSGGVARSTDAGITWSPGSGLVLHDVEMAESDASRVYAQRFSVLYRSDDGGLSFSSMGQVYGHSGSGSVVLLAAHPLNADLIAVGLAELGYPNVLGAAPEIVSSDDGGETWYGGIDYSLVDTPNYYGLPTALVFDPTSMRHVYFGMFASSNSGFLHNSSGGAYDSWTVQVEGIDNYSINELRGDASGANTAGIGDWRLSNWQLFRSPSDLDVWETLQADGYVGGGVLEVSETPGLMWTTGLVQQGDLGGDIVLRSTDYGNIWWPSTGGWPSGGLPPGLGSPGHMFQPSPMVANHGDGSTAYISGYGGSYKSTDQGDSWELVNPMQFLDGVVDPNDANRLFVTGYNPSVQLSTDGGASYTPRSSGLPPGAWNTNHVGWIFMRRADPDYLEVVYTEGQVWETFDAGLSWSLRFSLDVQGASIYDVTWDEATGHIFAAVYSSSGVVNAVASTHPLFDPNGLPATRGTAVHWDSDKSILLAGVEQAGLWMQSIASPVDAPVVAGAANLDLRISPNPTNNVSSVRFEVPREGAAVRAEVFDATGRRVRRLVDASLPGGARELFWDGRTDGGQNTSAGVYFVKVRVANEEASARMVRIP